MRKIRKLPKCNNLPKNLITNITVLTNNTTNNHNNKILDMILVYDTKMTLITLKQIHELDKYFFTRNSDVFIGYFIGPKEIGQPISDAQRVFLW